MSENFNDRLYTFLYQALRAGGHDLNIRAMEQLRNSSRELGELFKKQAEEEAIKVGEKIQKEVEQSFSRMESDISKFKEDIHEELNIVYNGPDDKDAA